MGITSRRVYGDSLNFKSLSRTPVNELGVVYLFGVLHEIFDFEIESIQSGFPDCIARRRIANGRLEELKIEFEFESKSFQAHGLIPHRLISSCAGTTTGANAPRTLRSLSFHHSSKTLRTSHVQSIPSARNCQTGSSSRRNIVLRGRVFQRSQGFGRRERNQARKANVSDEIITRS